MLVITSNPACVAPEGVAATWGSGHTLSGLGIWGLHANTATLAPPYGPEGGK